MFNVDGLLYPDSLVGTDSYTTMINGLGVGPLYIQKPPFFAGMVCVHVHACVCVCVCVCDLIICSVD